MSQVSDTWTGDYVVVKDSHKCMHLGELRAVCDKAAEYAIVLELRATAAHTPAVTSPIVYLCEEHVPGIEWRDVVDENGWKTIGDSFELKGYARPIKTLSNIKVVKLQREIEAKG